MSPTRSPLSHPGGLDKNGKFYIGNKLVIIDEDDFIIAGKEYQGTPGLWELIVAKNPNQNVYKAEDLIDYREIMIKTNALRRENDPTNPRPKSSSSSKWYNLLRPIWGDIRAGKTGYERTERERTGDGLRKKKTTTVIPYDPNALLERFDLLMASKGAGHTGVKNELVSICDELKRQRVLDTKTYKKINVYNIKMITSQKRGYKRNYAYGGAGIFDTLANFLTKLFTSQAAKQIASSAVDVGKSVAKEGAKKALEVGKTAAIDAGKKLVQKALTPKSKKIMEKYKQTPTATTQPVMQDVNTLIDVTAIDIQDLVKKLNSKKGSGVKVL